MGPTIVFSIPWRSALSNLLTVVIWRSALAGIVTIPIGCIAGGLRDALQINGQPVEFTFALILMNMIPVLIVAVLVALGLKFIPEKMINGSDLRQIPRCIDHPGLAAAVVKFLLGWELIPALILSLWPLAINPVK